MIGKEVMGHLVLLEKERTRSEEVNERASQVSTTRL